MRPCHCHQETYLTQRTIVIPNPGILPLQPCGCFWLYIVLWRRRIPCAIAGGRISSISRVISRWGTPVIIRVAISIWRLGVLLPHSSACASGWLQHPDELPGKWTEEKTSMNSDTKVTAMIRQKEKEVSGIKHTVAYLGKNSFLNNFQRNFPHQFTMKPFERCLIHGWDTVANNGHTS